MTHYFSDREKGPKPRSVETIDPRVWGGLFELITTRIDNGAFGHRFPEECGDGFAFIGCNSRAFERALLAEIPDISWPLRFDEVPDASVVMDLLEFCAAAVGQPARGQYHSYFRHYHLTWDRDEGLRQFVEDVNRIFMRNGLAYELSFEGKARRVLSPELVSALSVSVPITGDPETDRLIEAARKSIASHRPTDRQDALEKLWDAFERLKTLGPGSDKKAKADGLLDSVARAGSQLRVALGEEAHALTGIGNKFRIRHSEVTQEALETDAQRDYLFHRMFSFMNLALRGLRR
ncbi:MAG: hypothetical protein IKE42_16020 [Aquamicrobium sp.]|nr:hypothetical protein [Aquamicrobium sp.]